MSVERKVVAVTGASQGIGAGLVAAYRARGWAVVATSRSIETSDDPDVVTVRGDIADRSTALDVVAAAVERFGRLDTVINNAGIFIGKPFTDYTAEDYQAMIATNLTGFFAITQPALEHMAGAGTGHVVQVSTSLVDNPDRTNPSALASLTKGGLAAATRSLAVEYADRGIRINAVSPGVIETPMHGDADYEQLAALHPMHRVGQVADVVAAVLYLQDAPFVTGEILHVDGGMSAGH